MNFQKALVTGGAGFIGSHIVDALLARGVHVVVYDNLCTGQLTFLPKLPHERLELVKADTLDHAKLETAMQGCDFVFHFQANADVRGGAKNTGVDLEQNTIATWNV